MKIRTTRPGKGDNYFIRQVSGGYSTCVQGKPKDPNCDALANCVGYADGAYNEQLGLGYEKYHLNCNAENFIERAIASGLSVIMEPVVGGIMVWQKGDTLSGKDGAGHVAICIEKTKDYIITAESGYGYKSFWKTKRTNANGKWGQGSNYKYRGCILPVGYNPEPTPEPTPEPEPTPVPIPEPAPAPTLEIGDRVQIIGTGKETSYGTGLTAGGIGWTRYITKIYKDRPYPYQVGLKGKTGSTATTGFYKAEALKKL